MWVLVDIIYPKTPNKSAFLFIRRYYVNVAAKLD
jgi:hypothetical protein